MSADPRHGTIAGYNRIPCRDACCRLAMANYKKRWEWDRINGRDRIVSALGTRRRIEALCALGWSHEIIGARIGMTGSNLARLRRSETITSATAARIAAIYDELCMLLPTGNTQAIANVRNIAGRRGWMPPLAWDDIDDENETPRRGSDHRRKDDLDPVVVERVLLGENLSTTLAEKYAITSHWLARGGSEKALCDRMGWRAGRYSNELGWDRAEVAS